MPQEKIDLIASTVLLTTGAASYSVPSFVDVVDAYVLLGFHVISLLSVIMVVIINRKKFVNELKSFLK